MSRASVLARGRRAAGAGMTDTCVIRRATGRVTGPTGVVTTTWTEVYRGACRVQETSIGGDASDEHPGEATVWLVRRELQLPVATSTGVRLEDVAEMLTCQHDPDLVGRRLVVFNESAASEKTARRLAVKEVTS